MGLDLSNRLPLLQSLAEHCRDFPVILSTSDRVWFELGHLQTLSPGRWSYAELFSNWVGDPGYEIPVLKTDQGFIKQAKAHYAQNDYRAAAVYARAAFESKLSNFCSDRHLLVPYHTDPRQVSSQDLGAATLNAQMATWCRSPQPLAPTAAPAPGPLRNMPRLCRAGLDDGSAQ
jgi:hypothetical protein